MATPTLVQYSTFASQQGNTSTKKLMPLPNAVLSGNCVIVGITCDNGTTPTISDDKANTYTVLVNANDATHGQRLFIAYCLNVTNGPRIIQATGAGFAYCSATVMEFYNVATASATDGSNSNTGTDATPKPTAFTTASDGDLVVMFAVRDDAALPITSWSSPSGTAVSADIEDGWFAQYQIQSTHGSIQPSVTWDSAAYSWIAVAGAFKSATAGTAPTATPRVVGVHHQAINRAGTGTGGTWQLPTNHSAGNNPMLYASFIGVSADSLTSITDTPGNTWTATGANFVNGGSGNVRAFYSKAPSANAVGGTTLAYGGTGAIPGDTLMFFECVGMDQSGPFDNHTTNSGNQAAGTSFAGASNTPSTSSGLIFSTVGVTSNTVTGVSTSNAIFTTSTDPNEEFSPWPNDENNGWAYFVNTSTAAHQITWTNDVHVDNWAAIADSFKAVVATPDNPRNYTEEAYDGVSTTETPFAALIGEQWGISAANRDNVIAADASIAGAVAATFTGQSSASAALSASGSASVAGVGASTAASNWSAQSTASVVGVGAATDSAVISASATADIVGAGLGTTSGAASISSSATMVGDAQSTASGNYNASATGAMVGDAASTASGAINAAATTSAIFDASTGGVIVSAAASVSGTASMAMTGQSVASGDLSAGGTVTLVGTAAASVAAAGNIVITGAAQFSSQSTSSRRRVDGPRPKKQPDTYFDELLFELAPIVHQLQTGVF